MGAKAPWGDALLESLYVMQQQETLCDYSLASIEGKTIRVHGCVFGALSPALYTDVTKEDAGGGKGRVLNCSTVALLSFIKAVYTGKLNETETGICAEVVKLFQSLDAPMPSVNAVDDDDSDADAEDDALIISGDGVSGYSVIRAGELGTEKKTTACEDEEAEECGYDDLEDAEEEDEDDFFDDGYPAEVVDKGDIMGVSEVKSPTINHDDSSSSGTPSELEAEDSHLVSDSKHSTVQEDVNDVVEDVDETPPVVDGDDSDEKQGVDNTAEKETEDVSMKNASDLKEEPHGVKNVKEEPLDVVSPSSSPNKTKTKQKVNSCTICKKQFSTGSALRKHSLNIHQRERRFKCKQCSQTFVQLEQLNKHRLSHRTQGFPCKECEQIMSSRAALRRHIQTIHLKLKPFKCRHCQRPFAKKAHVISHESLHNRDPVSCPHCKKSCLSQKSLDRHLGKCKVLNKFSVRMREKNYKKQEHLCTLCGKVLQSKDSFKKHLRFLHNGERPFACRYCDKAFSKKHRQLEHENLHTGNMPFECSHCGKRFRQKETWSDHERAHIFGKVVREKKHACSFCGKAFHTPTSCLIHERSHTGERPFPCQECSRAFATKSDLKVHLRQHTGERPFQCKVCHKGFTRLAGLKCHQSTHTNDKPHKCSQCPAAYTQLFKLKQHIKKKHQSGSNIELLIKTDPGTSQEKPKSLLFKTSPNSKNLIVWGAENPQGQAAGDQLVIGQDIAETLEASEEGSIEPVQYMVVYLPEDQVQVLQEAAEGDS